MDSEYAVTTLVGSLFQMSGAITTTAYNTRIATQVLKFKVDVTDTTIVSAYYGHDRRVYSTDQL